MPANENEETSPRPVNHLMWEGRRLPCYVRAAVYQSGQAAGLGIKAADPDFMAALFQDPVTSKLIRDLLRQQVDEELALRGISVGILQEEIMGTIGDFVQKILDGAGTMATRKVAEGQPAEPGQDAWLEYPLNPNGQPCHALGAADRKAASRKVHRVKKGDLLLLRHPPTAGKDGADVRGEQVTPARQPRDVSLQTVAGLNATVAEDRLVAAISGIYREDDRGRVRVVQEVRTEEVNAATGDLPRTGVAATNVHILKAVRRGSGVHTTEDVFVGRLRQAGVLEEQTRVRARNLVVRGQVAGGKLPAEYLTGELDGLEEAAQKTIQRQLDTSQIEVEALFAARETVGRNVSAGTILLQTGGHTSGLEAAEDVRVDGNLIGGFAAFGRCLQILGDLGNAEETATRIRIGMEDRKEKQKERRRADIQSRKAKLEALTSELEAHMEHMTRLGGKSEYWAVLLKGEKRAPSGPVERRILLQFFHSVKKKSQIEQGVADGKQEIEDMEHLIGEEDEDMDQAEADLPVVIGGTVYPGVSIELLAPLEAEDLQIQVSRMGAETSPCSIQDIRRELTGAATDYLTPRQEKADERREALDRMFKGREKRPQAPEIPNKRFRTRVTFARAEPEADGQADGQPLPGEGELFVYTRDPQAVYLKRIWAVRKPLRNVTLSIERGEAGFTVRWAPNKTPITPWQRDAEVLERLEAVQVMGQSAREFFLA